MLVVLMPFDPIAVSAQYLINLLCFIEVIEHPLAEEMRVLFWPAVRVAVAVNVVDLKSAPIIETAFGTFSAPEKTQYFDPDTMAIHALSFAVLISMSYFPILAVLPHFFIVFRIICAPFAHVSGLCA